MKEISDKTGIYPEDISLRGLKPLDQNSLPDNVKLNDARIQSAFSSTKSGWNGITEKQHTYINQLLSILRNREMAEETITQLKARIETGNFPIEYEKADISIVKRIFSG
jgi:hypothetical protein